MGLKHCTDEGNQTRLLGVTSEHFNHSDYPIAPFDIETIHRVMSNMCVDACLELSGTTQVSANSENHSYAPETRNSGQRMLQVATDWYMMFN